MKKTLYVIPFAVFVIVMIFLYKGLHQDPHVLPSALIGQPVKAFSYPDLLTDEPITEKQLLGHVTLLHVWASWCVTCRAEHHVLKVMKYGTTTPGLKVPSQLTSVALN